MNKITMVLLTLLFFAVFAGIVFNNEMKLLKFKDEQNKIRFGFDDLELVFPTYFKIQNNNGDLEPDLNLIANTLNTTQEKVRPTRLERRWGQIVSLPFTPYPYRVGKPDGPKQIVFIYEKNEQKIRVEAYGDDLSKPVSIHEYPCCHW